MKLQTASVLLLLATSGVASAQPSGIARDHDSILAMQGEYTVDFAFDETVLLKPGYERAPAMRSGGNELVIVVEDTPKRIVLQHDALRRVLDHDHQFVAAAAHRRGALVAGLQQHGLVECEIDGVLALHGKDAVVVAGDAGGLRAGHAAGGEQQQDAGCLELHRGLPSGLQMQ